MDLNPQRVRQADFKTVKRGLDPEEVRRFLGEVADELENAQNQSTAMEARARAAVARLQELSDGAESQAAATAPDDVAAASADQVDTISRTLLLAQRTADTTIAQAEAEGERVLAAATEEASSTLDSTREMAAHLMEEAREEARKVGEAERVAVASEVSSLKARRDFLESDVDHLEQFLIAQRERLREAATAMVELTERVPGGLGEVRRPLVSAADDDVDAVPAHGEVTLAEERDADWAVESDEVAVDVADVAAAAGTEVEESLIDSGPAAEADLVVTADDDGAAEAELVEAAAGEVDVMADAIVDHDVPVTPANEGTDPATQEELLITPDIAEFPAEEVADGAEFDPTPRAFGIADASGEYRLPDDDGPARFTFDDNG